MRRGRAEREGVDEREGHGGGHRQTELGVERTGRPADEAHGDEDGHEDKGRGDQRRGDSVHGVDRGAVGRAVALVELGLHGLHDDDGVIDHRTDDQHQRKERQHVEAESRGIQEGEGPDQGDDNRECRDEGRTQTLQEDVDDQHHQDDGFNEGLDTYWFFSGFFATFISRVHSYDLKSQMV